MNNSNLSMNKLRIFLAASAVLFPLLSTHADDLIVFPSSPAAWTIDIVPATGANPATQMKKIDITRVGDVTRSLVTWMTGKPTERWSFGKYGITYVTETYNGNPSMMMGEDTSMGGDYAVGFDQQAFSWMKSEMLKDTVSYAGKNCLHYVGTIMIQHRLDTPTGAKFVEKPLHCEAWIDKDKLLPVALFNGLQLGVFTFHDAPDGPLVPPLGIKKAIEHYAAAARPLQ